MFFYKIICDNKISIKLQKCTFYVPKMRHCSGRLNLSKGATLQSVQGGITYGNDFKGHRS